jgi:hypothetical protein
VDEALLLEAVEVWCPPAFAASVRAAGIQDMNESIADVRAMRTIYARRQSRTPEGSLARSQIDRILDILNEASAEDIGLVHFRARNGAEGLLLYDQSGSPLFAFPITREDVELTPPTN